MDPLRDPLDGLSPPLYVATLSEIAHVDGLHPAARELLDQHAAHFGVDLDNLPSVPATCRRCRGPRGCLSTAMR